MAHHDNLSVPSQSIPSTSQQPNLTINSNMTTTMLPDTTPLSLPKPSTFLAPLATSTSIQPHHTNPITNQNNVTFPIHDPNSIQQPTSQDPFLTTTTTQPKWRVTPAQKEILMKAFDEDAYPELQKKVQLAETLGVTTTQISKWFQHRRESLTRTGQFKAQYNRTRRTPEELDVLQAAFEVDRYPTAERLAELEAQLAGVTAKQIKLWFKHRRKQVQKRNRTSTSLSIPSIGTNNVTYPSNIGMNQTVAKMMRRPDGTPSVTDLQRNDWRSNDPNLPGMVSTNPQLSQQIQSVYNNTNPSFPYMPNLYQYSSPCKVTNAFPQNVQFSEMELMALRGAHAVSNANPSNEGVSRLAQLLNRPQNLLNDWFRSQEPTRPLEGSTDTPQASVLYSPCLTQRDQEIDPKLNTTSRAMDLQSASLSQKDEKSGIEVELNQKNREKDNVQASSTSDPQHDPNGIVNSLNAQAPTAQSSANRSCSVDPSQGSVMTHPQANMYQTYLYQNAVDGRMMVPQQSPSFQPMQPGSTPVLAPLRYNTPATSTAPSYVPPNGMWYQQTTPYSK